MSASFKDTNNNYKEIEKDMLFQKIGNKWYVFAEIDNEMFFSPFPEGMDPKETKLELYEIIEEHMSKVASHKRRSPEASVA